MFPARRVTRYFTILGHSTHGSSARSHYLRILALAVRSRED
jgi:hypothetical protein